MSIRIPFVLDETAIRFVLKEVNLAKLGNSFSAKEITASLKWARVPSNEIHRFIDAVFAHGLIREPAPIPPRIPARIPLLSDRR